MTDNITLPREVRLVPCKPASFGAVDAFIWPHIAAKLVREQHAKVEQLQSLLSRIRQWDHLDTAADGAFWKHEIDAALRREETT